MYKCKSSAYAQQPKTRQDDGQQILTHRQTFLRQRYAETAERGLGFLQHIDMVIIDLITQLCVGQSPHIW